jgi:hypothetical protein
MKPINLCGQDGEALLVNPDHIVLVTAYRVRAEIRQVADGVDELVTPSYTGSTITLDVKDNHGQSVTVAVKESPLAVAAELYTARRGR